MHEWFRELVRGYMAEKGTSEEDIREAMPRPYAWHVFREVMTKEDTHAVWLGPDVVSALSDLWSLDQAQREELLVAYVGWTPKRYYTYLEIRRAYKFRE